MEPGIVIVSDDLIFYKLFETPLARKLPGFRVVPCQSYQELKETIPTLDVRLILLDDFRTSISSIEIIRFLRNELNALAPIWYFPKIRTSSFAYKSYSLGASKLIYRPFDPLRTAKEIVSIIQV